MKIEQIICLTLKMKQIFRFRRWMHSLQIISNNHIVNAFRIYVRALKHIRNMF